MLLMLLGILWHVFPVTSMILLAPYGKKWEGFYLSLFFGPVGLLIVLGIRKRLKERAEEQAEERRLAGLSAV
jgi:hypothetical protein